MPQKTYVPKDTPCPLRFWEGKWNPITGFLPAQDSRKLTKHSRRND